MFWRSFNLNVLARPSFFFSSTPSSEPVLTTTQIIAKTAVNHDSYIYKLKFIDQPFRLSIGQHFKIIETIKTFECPQGEEVTRKYTPINPCDQMVQLSPIKDVLDVLIKIYRPNSSLIFPNGGKLTPYLEKLNVGDKIHMEGPFGKFGYETGGNVILEGKKQNFKRIFFMAGGSGITPCYQVIREISKMKNEDIELILLFANKTEQDILLRKELQELTPRLKLHYILDNPPQNWTGFKGYATEAILNQITPLNDPNTLYAHCGPFAMNSFLRQLFKKKYPTSKLFKF